ncbi:hairy-related 3 [Brachionichthys hirsutus]|uniref:hairy-related 3 n=1 Tax=Brachionichthys hirsutus TaxID=412623 RepID=UPI003604BC39
MVAKVDNSEKSKPSTGNKVSKPLMEKKRRARINKCLDQLKSLLESYYSTSIRKRKLEKADILELTVNHLRSLQKLHSCPAAASEFSDYHSGFRRCLANVNQYLLMAENLNGSEVRCVLSQLPPKLGLSRGRERVFSTMDSSRGEANTRTGALEPAGSCSPEENERSRSTDPEPSSANTCLPRGDAWQPPGNKQAVFSAFPTTNSDEESYSHKKLRSEANTPRDVWRPW